MICCVILPSCLVLGIIDTETKKNIPYKELFLNTNEKSEEKNLGNTILENLQHLKMP